MTRDATFDQFDDANDAGDGDSARGDGVGCADDGTPARGDASADGTTDGPEPPVSTYRYAPDGAACATCGEEASRLWRNGVDPVCAACKDWAGE